MPFSSGSAGSVAVEKRDRIRSKEERSMADVGCAGILVADTFCGPMSALPDEGDLVAVDAMPVKVGGCAANVAIDVAKQGFVVEVAGCVGNDPAAELIKSGLTEAHVGCRHIVAVASHPTSTTVILLVEGQDRRYIHAFGANAAFKVAHIEKDWVASLKVFYLGGLLAIPGIAIPELCELLMHCKKSNVATVVDVVAPKGYRGLDELSPLLPHIDYFTPNSDEARQLTGEADPVNQLRAFARRGANTVIITCGEAGALAGRGGTCCKLPAYPMPATDPSGGGDAFTSGIITGILRGWELERMLPYAAALGASAIRAVGTTDSVFSGEEATAFVASHPLPVTCVPL
jgi:sugar/nucleoside kinase (ribokinase family)